jgi:predicted AlkP superfamily phosphohydrolase/phosphomutase
MSDHGFASFDRAVNLNSWLWHGGFLTLDGRGETLAHVDWSRTRAYAMGLNALYINLAGREKHGIVHPGAERDAVTRELARRLREFRDPEAPDAAPIQGVSIVGKSSSPFAPDLIVGYAPGYRASWETALGDVPADVVRPNQDAWIGDHCIAADAVPGILLGNRRPRVANPSLRDLAPTILKEFGVAPGSAMTGRPIY